MRSTSPPGRLRKSEGDENRGNAGFGAVFPRLERSRVQAATATRGAAQR